VADPRTAGQHRGGTFIRAGAIVVVGFFLALLAFGLVKKSPNERIDEALSQARAPRPPDFELPLLQPGELGPRLAAQLRGSLTDERISAAELRGQPVVLNFWASWCVPCRTEAPLLERTWKRSRPRGVLFVGLNMQDLTSDARDFMDEFELSYLNIRDESNGVATDWGVTGLPETFFLSAKGKVVAHVIGAISKEQLNEGIRAARAGRPLGALQGGDRRSTR
jgi:cytochrome c biogenesis protein CcmG/thiol:disulfide interchange protein DsbE